LGCYAEPEDIVYTRPVLAGFKNLPGLIKISQKPHPNPLQKEREQELQIIKDRRYIFFQTSTSASPFPFQEKPVGFGEANGRV
jgi:hypothetical protein